jgi:hypothetical protein
MYQVPLYVLQGGPGTTPTAGARVARGAVYAVPDFHYAQQRNPRAQRPIAAIAGPAIAFVLPWAVGSWRPVFFRDRDSYPQRTVGQVLPLAPITSPAIPFPPLPVLVLPLPPSWAPWHQGLGVAPIIDAGLPAVPTLPVGGGGKRHRRRRHRDEETQAFLADALHEEAQAEDRHQQWLRRLRHEEELLTLLTWLDLWTS